MSTPAAGGSAAPTAAPTPAAAAAAAPTGSGLHPASGGQPTGPRVAVPEPVKRLTILCGVVRRTHKELLDYHKELAAQKAKVEGMRARGADEYDIKKQVEVLGESEMMIPDTMRRLAKGVEDLAGFVAQSAGEAALQGSEALAQARALLAATAASAGGAGGAGGGAGEAEEEAI
jgi:tubulin-specific chaperone A